MIMVLVVALLVLAAAASANAAKAKKQPVGRWVAGDIHTHTWLTDGKNTQAEVVRNAFENFGLNYFANSEHGGTSTYNPAGVKFMTPVMRWITLTQYSYPIIQDLRELYSTKALIQGLEWNAPTHEHVSVGIVGAGNEPGGIGAFEYRFDQSDSDTSRANEGTQAVTHSETFTTPIADSPTGATESGTTVTVTTTMNHNLAVGNSVTIAGVTEAGYNGTFTVASVPSDATFTYESASSGLAASGGGTVAYKTTVVDVPAIPFDKKNVTADDTITAVKWLDENFGTDAYAVVNHPSRAQKWTVGDFRAMNDAAPDVAFGMEGLPGHQPDQARGGYSYTYADPIVQSHARTYGGADWMTSQVGGLWDSLLGEGRHFWIFNNSDYHTNQTQYKDSSGAYYDTQLYDFWPGQFAKTWTYVNKNTPVGVVDGMRAGDLYVVNGDLIDGLKFSVTDGKRTATMGQTLSTTAGKRLTVTISYHSPKMNYNGDSNKVDHVDLIAGDVTGLIDPSSPDYTAKDTNSTTAVLKSFARPKAVGGWYTVSYKVAASKSQYFRLRGTDLAVNTPNETDEQGNPLIDEASYQDIPSPDPAKGAIIAPTGATETGTTVTITTAVAHSFKVGDKVMVSGVGDGTTGYDGTFEVTTVPSTTTFTYEATAGLAASGGGIAKLVVHVNTPAVTWNDLWFYSNPVFVSVP